MNTKRWLSRILIAIVAAWNLQAAFVFIAWPQDYAPGFELTGIPGQAAVRGVGILFLMWNIPYLAALWNPQRNRQALWLTIAMQTTGLIGENLLWLTLPLEHDLLRNSILHFIQFDSAGLVLLLLAQFTLRNTSKIALS